jgi:uncharacterized membrane protein
MRRDLRRQISITRYEEPHKMIKTRTATVDIQRRINNLLSTFIFISIFSAILMVVLKNYNLRTTFYDLGQLSNILFSYYHSQDLSFLFSHRAIPIAAPLSILNQYLPAIFGLQLFSAIFILSGVIISGYLLCKEKLQRRTFIAVLLASPITWYAILFDFHFEIFLFGLLPAFFYFSQNYRDWRSALFLFIIAALISAIKEPYALTASALGAYLILHDRRYVVGSTIFVSCGAYFAFATAMIIPHFSEGRGTGQIWSHAFGHLGSTSLEMLVTVVSSPVNALIGVWSVDKLLYVSALFFPFLLTIRYSPIYVLPGLPTLLISLISHNDNHSGLAHQYSIATFLPLVIGLAASLSKLPRNTANRALAGTFVINFLLLVAIGPSPYSRLFWNSKIWSYEASAYIPDARTNAITTAIQRYVPKDPQVSVAVQNSINSSHLSNRFHYMAFPNGVFTAYRLPAGTSSSWTNVYAEYVLIDLKRPHFIQDQGCDWRWGRCHDLAQEAKFKEMVKQLRNQFDLLVAIDGFQIFRRKQRDELSVLRP